MSFEEDVTQAVEGIITALVIGTTSVGYIAPEDLSESEVSEAERWIVYAIEETLESIDHAQTQSNLSVVVGGASKNSTREAMSAKLDQIVTALRADSELGGVADDLEVILKQTFIESVVSRDYKMTIATLNFTVELTY